MRRAFLCIFIWQNRYNFSNILSVLHEIIKNYTFIIDIIANLVYNIVYKHRARARKEPHM